MLTTERLETPDGDFLDIDWMPETDPAGPLVLLLHGLEGHTKRGYMVQNLPGAGEPWNACGGAQLPRLFRRGEPGTPLLPLRRDRGCRLRCRAAPRAVPDPPAHGDGILSRRKRPPQIPGGTGGEERRSGFCGCGDLGTVRHCLGGNVLLKFLGEQGAKNAAPVSAAVAISVPYDLLAGAIALERGGMARIYSGYFLRSLLAKVRAKQEILANILDLDAVWASATLQQFDAAATAKLHGFAGAEDYYRKSSSNRFVQSVRTPTLLLHSQDDPFLPPAALPLSVIEANPFLTLVFTRRGGHVGFFEGGPLWNPAFWMEEQSASFLAYHHQGTPATTGDVHPIAPGWVDPNPENI